MIYHYDTYFQAKLAMYRLWAVPTFYPICAACGRPTHGSPEAHHVFLSQRYEAAHNDLRNLAPVHNQTDASCHQGLAHGQAKEVIATRLYLILGNGDPEKGRAIVLDAWTNEWTPDVKPDVPDILEGVSL